MSKISNKKKISNIKKLKIKLIKNIINKNNIDKNLKKYFNINKILKGGKIDMFDFVTLDNLLSKYNEVKTKKEKNNIYGKIVEYYNRVIHGDGEKRKDCDKFLDEYENFRNNHEEKYGKSKAKIFVSKENKEKIINSLAKQVEGLQNQQTIITSQIKKLQKSVETAQTACPQTCGSSKQCNILRDKTK